MRPTVHWKYVGKLKMKSMDVLNHPVIFRAFWINQKPAGLAAWQHHDSSLSRPRLRKSPPSSMEPSQRKGLPRSSAMLMRSKSRACMGMCPWWRSIFFSVGIKGWENGYAMGILRYFGIIYIYIFIQWIFASSYLHIYIYYMCICVYTYFLYIYISIYSTIYICKDIYYNHTTNVHTYRLTDIQTYIHTYIYIYIHTCTHPSILPSIHPYIHACMHAYIHIYIYIYVDMYLLIFILYCTWFFQSW